MTKARIRHERINVPNYELDVILDIDKLSRQITQALIFSFEEALSPLSNWPL